MSIYIATIWVTDPRDGHVRMEVVRHRAESESLFAARVQDLILGQLGVDGGVEFGPIGLSKQQEADAR